MRPDQTADFQKIISNVIHHFDDPDLDYPLYPRAEIFSHSLGAKSYIARINKRNRSGNHRFLSLLIHWPDCSSLNFNNHNRQPEGANSTALINQYVSYLLKEITLLGKLFKHTPNIEQVFLGCGLPVWLDNLQLSRIMAEIQRHFSLMKTGHVHVTVNPQLIPGRSVMLFREMGIDSITISEKGYNPQTQQMPFREHTGSKILNSIHAAQQAGFDTIRIELIYGSPKLNKRVFCDTLEKIIAMGPNLIHLRCNPDLPEQTRKHTTTTKDDHLSLIEDRFNLRLQAFHYLKTAGYVHIGLNLFARPNDILVIAQRQGRLHYDLLGYSACPDSDFVALGLSAISKIGPSFFQNHCNLSQYYKQLDQNKLPVSRGLELILDDILRRSVTHAMICHSVVSFESVEIFFSIEFKNYFATELRELTTYAQAGLIAIGSEEIAIIPKGKLFMGSICRVFDKYRRDLKTHSEK